MIINDAVFKAILFWIIQTLTPQPVSLQQQQKICNRNCFLFCQTSETNVKSSSRHWWCQMRKNFIYCFVLFCNSWYSCDDQLVLDLETCSELFKYLRCSFLRKYWLKVISYFRNKLHPKCLAGFWIRPWDHLIMAFNSFQFNASFLCLLNTRNPGL